MYKAEPNDTKNRPQELPYLVRDTTTTLIIRYCPDLADAESHAHRLNKIYYPEAAAETTNETETPPATTADSDPPTQFALF